MACITKMPLNNIKNVFFIILVFALFSITISLTNAQNTSTNTIGQKVIVIKVEGIIDTATEEYVNNAIDLAEKENAILIIQLNTPGGFLDSAMNIAIAIDKSTVPVIGFVVDKWAESAGTLVLVSTHIAAMQPGTIIGSMQPIEYNPTTGEYVYVNSSKIINPILKFLDEHAGNKGRNLTAIHLFVTENLNLGAQEALKMNVINYVARDINDLLQQLNSTEVHLPISGINYTIVTTNAGIDYLDMNLRQAIAHALSDPTISTLMLSLGTMILLFSLISGHLGVTPIGILLMLLGFIGSGYSISATSILLILFGTILLFIEHYVAPGFGIAGATGIIMIVLGIALSPTSAGYSVSGEYAKTILYMAYAVGIIFGGFTAITVYKVVQVRRRKPILWKLEGIEGKAIDQITPDNEGFILVQGEYWKARSNKSIIMPGDKVIILKKEGPILIVDKKEEQVTQR